ncbi:MAG: type II secretion system F family protein [Anaerolineae bacterium]|nr:type II secretion system F family protein [Anaerolineae bacterium]
MIIFGIVVDGPVILGAALVAFGLLIIFMTLTAPRKSRRAQTVTEREEINLLKDLPASDALSRTVLDLGESMQSLFEPGTRQKGPSRAEALMKAAGWWWAPGEMHKPIPTAPFWNMETYWGAKAVYMLMYGGVGLLSGLAIVSATGLPVVVAAAVTAVGAAIGFLDPDSKVSNAAKERQNLITIEMGFKVPELWTYAMTRGVETSLRMLAERPGGPFVSEVRRAVRLYDVHGSLAPGLKQMAERNTGEQIREFSVQLRMAAERGGRLLEALDMLSESARRAMGRYIRERTMKNLRAVRGQIMLWMGGLVFLLILGPVAILIAQSLLGG